MSGELPEPQAVKILPLAPGDVIVAEVQDYITAEQATYLKTHLEAEFPGHKIVVLSGGITLTKVVLECELA